MTRLTVDISDIARVYLAEGRPREHRHCPKYFEGDTSAGERLPARPVTSA